MHFEKVKRFKDIDLAMPERKTMYSAGYDFVVAEDIVIPPASQCYNLMAISDKELYNPTDVFNIFFDPKNIEKKKPKTLEDMAILTKLTKAKPSLVSTGMKCYLDPNTYLELSVRSSCPLKSWLFLANGVGVIDKDYVDNIDNEGEIFFQLINLSPYEILLRRGDIIGQGIIKPYLIVDNDEAKKERVGGFGSTSKQ